MRASFVSLAVTAASLLAACHTSSSDLGDASFEWVQREPLPIPRTELGVVAAGGKLYALGGSSGSTLARVDEYDPATGMWTRKADMHVARRGFVAGVIDGKIYVGPGMSWTNPNSVTYVMSTEVYDPVTDTWTDLTPCPSVSASNDVLGNLYFGGGAVNGRLYVVAVTNSVSFTFEYDPGTDTWRSRAAAPLPPFSELAAAPLGGELYVYSSTDWNGATDLASYDPVEDLWISRPAFSGPFRPALVASNGKLYALVGLTASFFGSGVHVFDPGTGRWTQEWSILTPRENAGAAELGGHVLLVGGDVPSGAASYSGTPSAVVEEGIPR